MFELLLRFQKGLVLEHSLPRSLEKMRPLLTQELTFTLEALRAYQDQELLNDIPELQRAHAKNLAKKIEQLEKNETYTYPTGFQGHALYLTIERRDFKNQDCLIFRIDNLDGIEELNATHLRHHVLNPQQAALSKRVYPSNLCTPRAAFINNPWPYLNEVARAKWGEKSAAISALYDENHQLPERYFLTMEETSSLYPSRRMQTVNNCSVKNWQIGLQIRWQEGNPHDKNSHEIYRWFRQEEPQYLKAKYHKMPTQSSPNPQQDGGMTSLDSMPRTPVKEEKDSVYQGLNNHGLLSRPPSQNKKSMSNSGCIHISTPNPF